MFCKSCHGDLADFATVINKMSRCPLCGAPLEFGAKKITQKHFNAFCTALLKNKNVNVFADIEELKRETAALSAPDFNSARDKMQLLILKNVPAMMFKAKDASDGEKSEILNECQSRLCFDLGLSFVACKEMLNALQKSMWQAVLPIEENFGGDVFRDPRDGKVYKTVKIGDRVWMAENLRYKCVGESNGLYSLSAVKGFCGVKGWKVPSMKEFQELINEAGNAGYGNASTVLMKKDAGWEKDNVTPTDVFGFGAVKYNSSYVDFYTSTKHNESSRYNMVLRICAGGLYWENSDGYCAVRLIKEGKEDVPSAKKPGSKK